MSNRYNVTSTQSDYRFVTDTGLRYTAYFTTYYLTGADGQEIEVPMFGFSCDPPRKLRDGTGYDDKVKNTIIGLIQEFFSKQEGSGLLYICDTSDDLGRHRNITFGRWFNEIDNLIERYKGTPESEKNGFYTSLLIHANNPRKEYYIDAFYSTLRDFNPE